MIFSSLFFLYIFLPVTLIVYFLVPMKLKNTVLLIFSLIFYAWGEPVYIFLMLFSIVFNYLSGIEIASYKEQNLDKNARICFWVTTAVNLAILGFFKYYGFLLDNLNAILPFHIPYRQLALPVGISFYTFQTLSYIIDVYWGNVQVQKNIINFGTYVTMFPQLIAGPIVQYSDIAEQLVSREISAKRFGEGVTWFLRGLGKKVLFANNIGMVYGSIAALGSGGRSVITAWIGCAAYTFQIYFDFSGYSDMAVGLGKMFGFDFVKNFDYPYISSSITEFWRRWHISLSTWFRDYVYIPLGGNRCSKAKNIRNIFVVWILTGFWHGAAWNFIFWGLYYGILLLLEKFVLKEKLQQLPSAVKHIYTMIFVMIGWMLFAAPSLGSAMSYIGNMLGIGASGFLDSTALYYLGSTIILFILMIFCSGPLVYKRFRHAILSNGQFNTVKAVVVYIGILILCTAYLVNATYNPFLYFRF